MSKFGIINATNPLIQESLPLLTNLKHFELKMLETVLSLLCQFLKSGYISATFISEMILVTLLFPLSDTSKLLSDLSIVSRNNLYLTHWHLEIFGKTHFIDIFDIFSIDISEDMIDHRSYMYAHNWSSCEI